MSTEEQVNGPEAQRVAIERYAAANALTVVAWHYDIGISGGAEIDDRPGLLGALDSMRDQRAGVLIVAKRDRLARDTFNAALVERLAAKVGGRIDSAEGAGNGSNPEDALMRHMLDGFAAYERTLIRLRTKAALKAKSSRGERVGGIPYGKALADDGFHLVTNPAEAFTLGQIRAWRAEGLTLQEITDRLNAAGTPARGARWHLTTVANLCKT